MIKYHPGNLISPFAHQFTLELPVVDVAEVREDPLCALGVEILRVQQQSPSLLPRKTQVSLDSIDAGLEAYQEELQVVQGFSAE